MKNNREHNSTIIESHPKSVNKNVKIFVLVFSILAIIAAVYKFKKDNQECPCKSQKDEKSLEDISLNDTITNVLSDCLYANEVRIGAQAPNVVIANSKPSEKKKKKVETTIELDTIKIQEPKINVINNPKFTNKIKLNPDQLINKRFIKKKESELFHKEKLLKDIIINHNIPKENNNPKENNITMNIKCKNIKLPKKQTADLEIQNKTRKTYEVKRMNCIQYAKSEFKRIYGEEIQAKIAIEKFKNEYTLIDNGEYIVAYNLFRKINSAEFNTFKAKMLDGKWADTYNSSVIGNHDDYYNFIVPITK